MIYSLCQTQADSLEEAKENIKEAVELYLGTLTAEEKQSLQNREVLAVTIGVVEDED
jgi:predicted RNase H-like HicB family nuclease